MELLEVCTWELVEGMLVELQIHPLPMELNKVEVAVWKDLPCLKEFFRLQTQVKSNAVSKEFSLL